MLRFRLKTLVLATAFIAAVICVAMNPSNRAHRLAHFVQDGNLDSAEAMLAESIADDDKFRGVVRHVCRYPSATNLLNGERTSYANVQPITIAQLVTGRRSVVIGRDLDYQQIELIVTPFGIHEGRFWPCVLKPNVVVYP